ncbi:hypothetical protein [Micromonospora sp. KC606]|uniref:hypothetical protein n=1 Tax=Micromonospora sp. KC606 TaxID=2530379 RepID=UPI00140478AD|nr:hypothetical protein [Micromonospora sp. KC606]
MTDEQIRELWLVYLKHDAHGRCWPWAAAFAELVAADRFLEGPPADLAEVYMSMV